MDGELIHKFDNFTKAVHHGSIKLVNGREMLAAWSEAGEVFIFDLSTNEILLRIQETSGDIFKIRFSPWGTHIAAALKNHTCKIWALNDGRLVQTLEGHTDEVAEVLFSSNGDRLATLGADNKILVWQYCFE